MKKFSKEEVALVRKELGIPRRFKILGKGRGNITIQRPDGFIVFISAADDPLINRIRLYGPDKNWVAYTVAMYRGMQILDNYLQKYNPDYHSATTNADCYINGLKSTIDMSILEE